MNITHIKKRNGEIAPFDINRIHIAITKAYQSHHADTTDIPIIVDDIATQLTDKQATMKESEYIDVEYIQDIAEKTLMKYQKFDIAKTYILYREEHKRKREEKLTEKEDLVENKALMVTKEDESKQAFDRTKIENTYNYIAKELKDECSFDEIKKSLSKYLVQDIATKDIMKLFIKTAINLISIQNTKWQYIAGRLATIDLYKHVKKNR